MSNCCSDFTEHPQVSFITSNGLEATVDVGLYRTCLLLKRLGVETLYSCEGGNYDAYILMDGRDAMKLFKYIRRLERKHLYTQRTSDFLSVLRKADLTLELERFAAGQLSDRHSHAMWSRFGSAGDLFAIGSSYSRTYGWRTRVCWTYPRHTERFERLLEETCSLLGV